MSFDFSLVVDSIPKMLMGLGLTLELMVVSAVLGTALAIVLLLGGGLVGLQAMVISTGLPFTVILLLMCWAIFKGLQTEPR